MKEKLFELSYKIRSWTFTELVRETVERLFPFALIGSVLTAFRKSVLDDYGFVNNVFDVPSWWKHYDLVDQYMKSFSHLTLGILGVLAAFFMAELTLKATKHPDYLAGLTAAIGYLLLFTPQGFVNGKVQLSALSKYTGMSGLLLGILFGYLIGRLFLRFVVPKYKGNQRNAAMLVTAIVLALALLVNIGISQLYQSTLATDFLTNVSDTVSTGSLKMTVLGTFLTTTLRWLGLRGVFEVDDEFASVVDTTNMMYALKHHSVWLVPYPFSEQSLYHSFGVFGGVGGILALAVAIYWVSHSRHDKSVIRMSLIPTLFGSGQGMLVGLPVLFNPIYVIPFILVPVVNVLLASFLIMLKVMPPAVYPVPIATPGPLIGFIGSGGNWLELAIGVGIFVLDVLIYMPFVKLDNRLQAKLGERADVI